MGKIKSKLIRRTGNELDSKNLKFTESFETNKKILGKTMPSKKMRNQIAGYLSRIKKQQKKSEIPQTQIK